jgi:DNA-binding XRE family transcriptional regulator
MRTTTTQQIAKSLVNRGVSAGHGAVYWSASSADAINAGYNGLDHLSVDARINGIIEQFNALFECGDWLARFSEDEIEALVEIFYATSYNQAGTVGVWLHECELNSDCCGKLSYSQIGYGPGCPVYSAQQKVNDLTPAERILVGEAVRREAVCIIDRIDGFTPTPADMVAARSMLNITKKEAAELVNISESTWARMEGGNKEIPLTLLYRLNAIYEIGRVKDTVAGPRGKSGPRLRVVK